MTDNSPIKEDFGGNVVKSERRTLMEAMRVCLKEKYACFNGRASRSEYWYFMLGVMILFIALMIIVAILGAMGKFGGILGLALYIVALLGVIVPSIAVTVRRLHDANLTGWIALANLVPFIGSIAFIVIGVLPPVDVDNKFND